MGMVAPVYYSAEMVRALPDDGKRYETVHGELLVTPAPTAWHQEIIDRLRDQLKPFIKKHSVGHLFSAPADISWGPDVLVQPDLFVVPLDQARTFDWSQMQDLLLSIEVLSPSTSRYDRFTKRRLYQEVGTSTGSWNPKLAPWRCGRRARRFQMLLARTLCGNRTVWVPSVRST